ncbi:hypothetical protein F4677DRAFT_137648 [Hypoxylon crocopeplum]|nr:hypothetical protein F4677DRAFT_137648 [Hypoxylon crocopeplum]
MGTWTSSPCIPGTVSPQTCRILRGTASQPGSRPYGYKRTRWGAQFEGHVGKLVFTKREEVKVECRGWGRCGGGADGASVDRVTLDLSRRMKISSKPHWYVPLLPLQGAREPRPGQRRRRRRGFVRRQSLRPAEFAEKHGLRLVAVNWMTCAGDRWAEGS